MDGLLHPDEVEALLLAFLHGRDDRGCTEDEIQALVNWAEDVRFQSQILSMILDGQLEVVEVAGAPDGIRVRPAQGFPTSENGAHA